METEVKPTQENNKLLSQYIAIKIKEELKEKPNAQDFINDVKGIIIK